MPRGLPAAGRRAKRSSRSSKRAGVSASTFTAQSIFKTGQTRMIEAMTIDAASTIKLLESIEVLHPMLVLIHVFLDNARYHHAKLVREWLARPGCRIKLHFVPPYCPHLNPIERLWGPMHRNVTHNKCYATCGQFADATLDFLRDKVPRNWADFCDSVTDNFRVNSPKDFRVMT
ncbi:MAG: transposase [Methylocella sp.]